jgi:uncharacterized protein with PIN domain
MSDVECAGQLAVFIADESSWRCRECGWIGWPRQDVDRVTGVILRQYPHTKRAARALIASPDGPSAATPPLA